MNMISFSQFDNSPTFSGENSDPNEKEDSNGEFSALLSSFYVPPPVALPASLPTPDSTAVSGVVSESAAAGDARNVAPLGGQINFATPNLSTANNLFAKISDQETVLPQTPKAEVTRPEKTAQAVPAPDDFWSGKIIQPNPKSDKTGEINVRLPVLRKASETTLEQPVGQRTPATDHVENNKDLPANPQNKGEFAATPIDEIILPEKLQVEHIKSVKTTNKGLSVSDNFGSDKVLPPNSKSETDWRAETKIEAKPSIGLPKGLSKIFQALAEAPVEKPVAPNFLNPNLNRTEKDDSSESDVGADETFSLDDLINQDASPNAAQNLHLERASEKSPEFKLEQTSPVTQISEVIKELSAKISQLREPQLIKLRLRPAELGTVEIRVEQNLDGKINAHLTTHLESTRQIFTENISELRSSLQQAGWQVDHLEISCESFSTANFSSSNNQSQSQQTPMQPDGTTTQNPSLHSEPENSNSPDLTVERNSHRLLSVRA